MNAPRLRARSHHRHAARGVPSVGIRHELVPVLRREIPVTSIEVVDVHAVGLNDLALMFARGAAPRERAVGDKNSLLERGASASPARRTPQN